MKVRNPWGAKEWNGRWSDGSKEWSKEWLKALEPLEHEFGDDGVFIMEYSDFLTIWTGVERTQLFNPAWIQSSHWLNVESRPLPSAWQFGDVSCAFLFVCPVYLYLMGDTYSNSSYLFSTNCIGDYTGSISIR